MFRFDFMFYYRSPNFQFKLNNYWYGFELLTAKVSTRQAEKLISQLCKNDKNDKKVPNFHVVSNMNTLFLGIITISWKQKKDVSLDIAEPYIREILLHQKAAKYRLKK